MTQMEIRCGGVESGLHPKFSFGSKALFEFMTQGLRADDFGGASGDLEEKIIYAHKFPQTYFEWLNAEIEVG